MNDQDIALYQQAVALANAGQTRTAYDQFYLLRSRGNEDIELYFWLVATTPYPAEAQLILNAITFREPTHPSLYGARIDHERKLQQMRTADFQPTTVVIRCPVCQTYALVAIKRKVSTGGWVVFVILLVFTIILCWVGLLIQEEYRVCSNCGVRLG
jgi:hypothetical protein